ncbi:LmbE-like protein [Amylocystis lapponica]|nr:LmbE-like protein [Amylocystis lapponica]
MSTVSVVLFLVSILLSVSFSPLVSRADVFAQTHSAGASRSGSSRILLLTAHPDDECMFFAPTILGLLADSEPRRLGSEVFSLCLSIGDADGLGDIRRGELARSLDVLGIPAGRRWALDRPDLKDNITAMWDSRVIAAAVRPYVLENHITTILTFDYHGISEHPNHRSLVYGVADVIASLAVDASQPPRAFALLTVPLLQKYTGMLAPFLAKAYIVIAQHFTYTIPEVVDGHVQSPVFVSGIAQYQKAIRAMLQHHTQLEWFRWLYVVFSRYMWVNEWAEILPSSPGGGA